MNIALFYLMHIYCICLVNCDASYAGQNKKIKLSTFSIDTLYIIILCKCKLIQSFISSLQCLPMCFRICEIISNLVRFM